MVHHLTLAQIDQHIRHLIQLKRHLLYKLHQAKLAQGTGASSTAATNASGTTTSAS